MGFPVPFADWTRDRWQPVVRDVLLDRRTRERGFMNAQAVERLLDAHQKGTVNGGDAIWALMNFELWFRTFIDGEGVQTLSEVQPRAASTAAPLSPSPFKLPPSAERL
jgi:hypothetical protein